MDLEVGRLRIAAGVLAALVAAIHLLHPSQGGVALLVYAQVGYLGDPRPLLFSLGGFAIVFGLVAATQGVDRRPLYLGGILLTLGFLVGFVLWHTALDHGGLWPHLEANRHGHEPLGAVMLDHLLGDSYVLVSKLAELALLAVLVVLYRVDRPTGGADRR